MEALFKLSCLKKNAVVLAMMYTESSLLCFWSVLACCSKHSVLQDACVSIRKFSFMHSAYRPRLYYSVVETNFLLSDNLYNCYSL